VKDEDEWLAALGFFERGLEESDRLFPVDKLAFSGRSAALWFGPWL
jgi:hypothetical protein